MIHAEYDERKSGKRQYGKARGLALDSMRPGKRTAAESRPHIANFDRREGVFYALLVFAGSLVGAYALRLC